MKKKMRGEREHTSTAPANEERFEDEINASDAENEATSVQMRMRR